MILLDLDHVSILLDPRQKLREQLMSRIGAASDSVCLPIIVVEKHMRGWLAAIHRVRDVHKQVIPYLHLANLIDFLTAWTITDWNETAADIFTRLRREKVRIGTQDLKIASIAIANGALLLSSNLRDFETVPGLNAESWLAR